MNKVKLFISDIDGTLTDGTVYYSTKGEELKQFSHRDGRGFYLLKNFTKVKAYLLTNEIGGINKARAKKFIELKIIDGFIDSEDMLSSNISKKDVVKILCLNNNCDLSEVAYIGDDTNDIDCLKLVGFPACPNDAHKDIKKINNILITEEKGGKGAVREFIDYLIENDFCYK